MFEGDAEDTKPRCLKDPFSHGFAREVVTI